MSLRNDAQTLSNAIQGIVNSLKRYSGNQGRQYIHDIHSQLAPKADAFQDAIGRLCDREVATQILSEIQPLMSSLAAATTKGEIPVFGYKDKHLDLYYQLHTIFRESRYRNSTLQKAEQAGAANPCACGTSGTSAAEQPLVPEASRDS
jgi:hypothetical protein